MIHSDALILIDSIRRNGYKPNDWEADFMQSIEMMQPRDLTFKQHIALEKIYTKATGGGPYQRRQRI